MKIDKQEVRRYLGFGKKTADGKTEKAIDACITEVKQRMHPREIHHTFNIIRDGGPLRVDAENLNLEGESIRIHLSKSRLCVIMAATLGPEIDKTIRYISRKNLSEAIIMDAVATVAIEAFCDEIESSVISQAKENALFATHRFSPGYGDLPLSLQPHILRALDAPRKIGLTTTEKLVMIPRKSVTAIIGLQQHPACSAKPNCKTCMMGLECPYRKEDD